MSSESLDAEQRQAVHSDATTLRVMAAAGSGKTRVLTQRVARRISDESVDPAHTLVLTFTRKAADELRTRLKNLTDRDAPPVITGTFHAIAFAQLRQRWIDQGKQPPAVVSQPTRLINAALEKLSMNRLANPRLITAELSWAKAHQLRPDTYGDGVGRYNHKPPVSPNQMVRIYEAYEWEKKRRRTIDYDDLLLLMTDALRTDRSFANTQRWLFRHFFVDEFQDLNTAQFELLRHWLGTRDDLFVVGDPNQSIYGWNGADATYLNQLGRFFPQTQTITLRTNYRSSKAVLNAARSLIEDTVVVPEDAIAGELPVVRAFDDDGAEAEGVAKAVRDAHHRGQRWSDIAILVRTNTQRGPIEAALQKFSIPFHSAGGAAWLYEPEVRAAMDYLRDSPGAALAQRAADIDEMIEESGEAEDGFLHQLRAATLTCLTSNETMTVGDFLSWVEVGSRQDGPRRSGAITVTTFHRAKGLEWPVVFLAGIEDGLVPIGNADIAEERRLFYVAVTRAREEVHLSWARKRASGLSSQTRAPSPWLSGLLSAQPPVTDITETVHSAIEEGRAALHVEHSSQPARDALHKWRKSRAMLTGVEARLILDDRVIDEIIAKHPSSRDELSEIDGLGPVRAANIGDELLALLGSGGQ